MNFKNLIKYPSNNMFPMFVKREQRQSHTDNFLHSTTLGDIFSNKIPNNLRSHSLVQPHGLESSSNQQNCWCHLETNYRNGMGSFINQQCLWEIRKDCVSQHSWLFSVRRNQSGGSEAERKRNRNCNSGVAMSQSTFVSSPKTAQSGHSGN